MDKHLLKKWTIVLLLGGALFSSCIDKDYDLDNFDGDAALKNMTLLGPLGTIEYSVTDIVNKANFNHPLVTEGDTVFLLYNQKLDFSSDPGQKNSKSQYINIFNDIAPEGSKLLFSNPIFNCIVTNEGTNPALLNVNYVTGTKEGYTDIRAEFDNGRNDYFINVKGGAGTITTQRFDRANGKTHQLFTIGSYVPGQETVGPDTVKYSFSLTTPSNDSIHVNMEARLPLSFDAGSMLVFKDTLPIDLSSYEDGYLETLIMRIHYTAQLPTDGNIEIIFLDENNLPATDINVRNFKLIEVNEEFLQAFYLNLSNGEKYLTNSTAMARKGKFEIKLDKSELEAAKNIKSMAFISTLNTGVNIHILPSDFLRLKVDFYLQGNIKL